MLSDEHRLIRQTIRSLVEKEYPPAVARAIDEEDRYPQEVLGTLAELGFTGLTVPEEYGGAGRDVLAAIIVVEELARRSLAVAWVYVEAVFFGGENIARMGDARQREWLLPRIAAGKSIYSYALTEPNVGSDTAAVQTRARRDGDKFIVNGTKMFISAPHYADYILCLCRTNPDVRKHKGLSFLIIDGKAPGVEPRSIDKIGTHGSDTCELVLTDVEVPLENVLGGPEMIDAGWGQLLGTLDTEHAQVAAGAVGTAQGAMEEAISYAKVRTQFDQPIGKFQAVSHMIANMATSVAAARLLTYHVAELAQQEAPCWAEGAMAKLFATETAKSVCLDALQIHGGYGYMKEFAVQRFVRDSLMLPIGGGTSQAQRNIIAGSLGL